jgi:hypothetical protein
VGRTLLMRRYLEDRYQKAIDTHPYFRDTEAREWIEQQEAWLGIAQVDDAWLAELAPGTILAVAGLSCTKGDLDLWTCGHESGGAPLTPLNSKKLTRILARIPRAHRVRVEWSEGVERRAKEFDYGELRRLWSGKE